MSWPVFPKRTRSCSRWSSSSSGGSPATAGSTNTTSNLFKRATVVELSQCWLSFKCIVQGIEEVCCYRLELAYPGRTLLGLAKVERVRPARSQITRIRLSIAYEELRKNRRCFLLEEVGIEKG